MRAVETLADLRLRQRQAGKVAARLEPTDRDLVEAQARGNLVWPWVHRSLRRDGRFGYATAAAKHESERQPQAQWPPRRAADLAREPLRIGLPHTLFAALTRDDADKIFDVIVHDAPLRLC
jgi:hypothetical protein